MVPQNNPVRDISRKLSVRPEWLLVGQVESAIVASCMVGYDGHRGWINSLAVKPALQRNGYGEQMMDHAKGLLIDIGCPKINLQVRTTNQDVIDFYKRLGFSIDNVVSMGLRLEEDDLPTNT